MKCTHVCAAQIAYQLFIKLYDFPSLADEIADPRPYMNIKVVAFTVSEKSSNTKTTNTKKKKNSIQTQFVRSDKINVFDFNVRHMETGQQIKVSIDRLVTPGIKPVNPKCIIY